MVDTESEGERMRDESWMNGQRDARHFVVAGRHQKDKKYEYRFSLQIPTARTFVKEKEYFDSTQKIGYERRYRFSLQIPTANSLRSSSLFTLTLT